MTHVLRLEPGEEQTYAAFRYPQLDGGEVLALREAVERTKTDDDWLTQPIFDFGSTPRTEARAETREMIEEGVNRIATSRQKRAEDLAAKEARIRRDLFSI